MENVGVSFERYVGEAVKRFPNEPLCPFPDGGECHIPQEERSCLECDFAKSSYQKFVEIVIKESENLRYDSHHRLRGARVFCVACGAGARTPLRRWKNSYLCEHCWKMLQVIGEEAFIERIQNGEN